MFTKSKVQFQEQQHDDYILENSVLQSKLRSKIEALTIMSKELDKCHMERDRYKVLVEQLKIKNMASILEGYNNNMYKHSMSGGELLAKTREQNNMLRLEVETLRSKLDEALGDISALRKQLHIFESNAAFNASSIFCDSNKEYEELVHQLEITHKKYQQLQLDYRATLDEKEELASDRDYYKSKVMRLNHQISVILNRAKASREDGGSDGPKPIVDVDSVVNENKYLHERITQLQVEKEIVKRNLNKYKNIIENRSKTDTTNSQKNLLEIMTQKQVRAFLDVNSKSGLKRSSAAELKSLCMGLFESLNDKAIALQHQRKTNQILANRVTELEKTLESWCNGEKYVPIFPSQMLLDEFIPDPEVSKDYAYKDNDVTSYHDNNDVMKDDSDDERSKVASEDSNDTKSVTSNNKTVLPHELEELVKEALAELRTIN